MLKTGILLIDSSKEELLQIQLILEKRDFRVMSASNALEGKRIAETEQIDIILLDAKDEDNERIELCKSLKRIPSLLNVPVIFLSKIDNKDVIIESLKAGAIDYIVKPFDEDELIQRILLQTEQRRIKLELEKELLMLKLNEKNFSSEIEVLKEHNIQLASNNEELHALTDSIDSINSLLQQAEQMANIGSWASNLQTGETSWSDQFFRICGFVPQEFIPNISKELSITHPDDIIKSLDARNNTIKSRLPYEVEKRIIRPDGEVRQILSKGDIRHNDYGHPVLYGTFLDITERKKNEQELIENQANLSALIENTPDGIWSVDKEKKIVVINDSLKRFFKNFYLIDCNQGDLLMTLMPNNARQKWEEYYNRALTGSRFKVVQTLQSRTEERIFEISFNPIYIKNQVAGVSCFSRDITDQRRAEQELRMRESEMRRAQEIAHFGNFSFNFESREMTISEELKKILELENNKFLIDDLKSNLTTSDFEEFLDLIAVARMSMTGFTHEFLFKKNNFVQIWINIIVDWDEINGQKIDKLLGIMMDISERKSNEQEIEIRQTYLDTISAVQFSLMLTNNLNINYNKILRLVGETVEADRVYVFHKDHEDSDRCLISLVAEWSSDPTKVRIHDPKFQKTDILDTVLVRWQNKLVIGKSVFGKAANFNFQEREFMKEQGIKSILLISLMVNDKFFGLIGFDHFKEIQSFQSFEADLLNSVASIISAHYEKSMAIVKLESNLENLKTLINQLPVAAYLCHIDGRIVFANQNLCKLLGCQAPENNNLELWRNSPVRIPARKTIIEALEKEQQLTNFKNIWELNGKDIEVNENVRYVKLTDHSSNLLVGTVNFQEK